MDQIEWVMIQEMLRIVQYGCTNHDCIFNPYRGGMHTNGICHCMKDVKEIAQKLKEGRV